MRLKYTLRESLCESFENTQIYLFGAICKEPKYVGLRNLPSDWKKVLGSANEYIISFRNYVRGNNEVILDESLEAFTDNPSNNEQFIANRLQQENNASILSLPEYDSNSPKGYRQADALVITSSNEYVMEFKTVNTNAYDTFQHGLSGGLQQAKRPTNTDVVIPNAGHPANHSYGVTLHLTDSFEYNIADTNQLNALRTRIRNGNLNFMTSYEGAFIILIQGNTTAYLQITSNDIIILTGLP